MQSGFAQNSEESANSKFKLDFQVLIKFRDRELFLAVSLIYILEMFRHVMQATHCTLANMGCTCGESTLISSFSSKSRKLHYMI